MNIKPKFGIDALVFGMKEQDVIAVFGKPTTSFKDEDDNIIYTYFTQKMRLTFYEDEDFKLGYIITSNPQAKLFDQTIIGKNIIEVQKELETKGLKKWEKETFDTLDNHFNEDFWLILQAEYDQIVKIEIGTIINEKDEFEWKFKG